MADQNDNSGLQTVVLHDENVEHKKFEVQIYDPTGGQSNQPKPTPVVEQTKYPDLPSKLYDKTLALVEYNCRLKKEQEKIEMDQKQREQFKLTKAAKPKREPKKILREGNYPDGTPFVVYDQLALIDLQYALGEKKCELYLGAPRAKAQPIAKPPKAPAIFDDDNLIAMHEHLDKDKRKGKKKVEVELNEYDEKNDSWKTQKGFIYTDHESFKEKVFFNPLYQIPENPDRRTLEQRKTDPFIKRSDTAAWDERVKRCKIFELGIAPPIVPAKAISGDPAAVENYIALCIRNSICRKMYEMEKQLWDKKYSPDPLTYPKFKNRISIKCVAPKEPSWSFRYRFGDGAYVDRPTKNHEKLNAPGCANGATSATANPLASLRTMVWPDMTGWSSNFKGKDPEQYRTHVHETDQALKTRNEMYAKQASDRTRGFVPESVKNGRDPLLNPATLERKNPNKVKLSSSLHERPTDATGIFRQW